MYFNNANLGVGLFIVVVFPIFLLAFLCLNFKNLDEEAFSSKFGNSYMEIPFKSRSDLSKHLVFFISRLVIVTTFVFYNDTVIQIVSLIASSTFRIILNGLVRPYETNLDF